MASTPSLASSSMATPRRPGGARPNPSSSRAAPPPPKLNIPDGNVPGVNVDQAGQGGWQQPSALPPVPNLPSLAMRPGRPMPSLASAGPSSSRPKLKLPMAGGGGNGDAGGVRSVTAPIVPTLGGLSTPDLSLTPPPQSARPTPSLKLAIPLGGGGGGAAFSTNEDDGSNLRTPVPGESEDRDVTVHARTYYLGGDEDFGDVDKMSAMTEDIRAAMSRMRFESSPAPSAGERSRSASNAGSTGGTSPAPPGSSGDDLTRLRAVNLSGISPSDGEDSRPSSVHSGHFDATSQFTLVRRLGEGTGGAVDLVKSSSGQIMARKVIARTANPSIHKQTLRELEFLSSTSSPYIVDHYGAFLAEHDSQICILMEYCEAGSLDSLLARMRETGLSCTEPVLGRIAASVLRGLDYLHKLSIIHRDIKPSNILVTRAGAVKLCDFGVSGELVGSFAETFTGTSYYMAPERILNKPYSIKADVWSLGLTLHEVAHLRFPFPPEGENQAVAPIELLSYIVTAPVPGMQDNPAIGRVWSAEIRSFIDKCLIRDGSQRPYPRELLTDPFIVRAESKNVNMAKWVAALVPSLVLPPADV